MPFFLTKLAKSSQSLPRFPFKRRKNTADSISGPPTSVPPEPCPPQHDHSVPRIARDASHVPDFAPSTGKVEPAAGSTSATASGSTSTSKAWHNTMLDSLSKTMSRSGLKMAAAAASNTLSSTSSLGSGSILGGHVSSTTSSHRSLSANVVFLDDTAQIFEVDKRAKGQVLLDMVHAHLEPIERQYFGLLFNDSGGVIMPQGHAPDVMRWLDPEKPIRKQMRALGGSSRLNGGLATPILYFRVKFYASDPARFIEDNTREHMYLQVKRDLQEGRLTAPISSLCMLASYSAQAKCGDYDHDATHKEGLMEFLCLRDSNNQPRLSHTNSLDLNEIHHKITELHKLHKGQTRADAICRFLKYATRLDMYGIAIHHGKDSSGKDIQLGVTSMGLVVFQNQVKINTFSWSKIVKISFKRKQFFIQLKRELSEDYDTLLGFNLASYRSCKNLWKSAVEHHAFFRLSSSQYSPKPKRAIFPSLSARFRQSGRARAGQQQPEPTAPAAASFSRTLPARKTLPLSLEVTNRRDASMPRLASPETSSIGSSVHSHGGKLKPSAPALVSFKRGSIDANSMTASSTSLAHRAFESLNNKVQSLSTKLPKKAWEEEPDEVDRPDRGALHSDDEGGFLDPARRISSLGRLSTSTVPATSTATKNGSNLVGPAELPHGGFGTRSGGDGFSIQATSTPIKGHQTTGLGRVPSNLAFGAPRLPFADESSVSGQSSGSHHTVVSASPSGGTVKSIANGHALAAHRAIGGGTATTGSGGVLQLSHPLLTKEDASSCSTSSTISINGGHPSSLSQVPGRSLSTKVPTSNSSATGGTEDDSGEGLVHIVIRPDENGRFGFNVKGGADQKTPIIVSKVGFNTQADKCFPKLNEGDQVVLINGREVSGHTHEQVVNFIRASREPHSGELILAVKQNVYMGEEVEEPEFQYVPERSSGDSAVGPEGEPTLDGPPQSISDHRGVSERMPEGAHKALSQSMLLLDESTASNAVFGQFEQLPRKNPSMAMSLCHAPANLDKNRYRDISPYDATRVILKHCPSGDYINANHVDMTIPGSGIINRYIATQGPLSTTSADFWYMTWEAQSTLIIMLTTIVERGRGKCHKYWPDMSQTLRFPGGLEVKCTRDSPEGSFAFRDFELCMRKSKKSSSGKKHRFARNKQKKKAKKSSGASSSSSSSSSSPPSSGSLSSTASNSDCESSGDDLDEEVRHVSQMAYLSWPDHGVPESPDEFIGFVEQVRTHRQGSFEPTIVHCSAGIGRTGVLILMETAMCLIEANQAVYPLDLTRQMRDQRASMVQTASQYKFVCEAILKVYKSGAVKPLPEFCQPLPNKPHQE